MNNDKIIKLTFDLGEVTNDVLVKCNQISQSIHDEAMIDIKANVLEPDSPETRSIINRAVTESFGHVKKFCQRYLKQGRTIDDNTLERMVKRVTFAKAQATDSLGHPLFRCTENEVPHEVYWEEDKWLDSITTEEVTPDAMPQPIIVDTDNIDTIEYEKITLELHIPNFNTSVTDHLKSVIHNFVVFFILVRFLQDQLPDKAEDYKAQVEEAGNSIIQDLNARERFNFRKPAWI